MVMTITEMRELKEQSSRSAGSISGKEAGGIYIRGLLCPARCDDQRYELIDGVLYDMAAPAVTHQEIAFEIADVKNQKVIVYDLGDDFGENMLYC